MQSLLPEPPATLLPDDDAAALAAELSAEELAATFPASPSAWAALAERALADGQTITGYAYARTGYHRGLDQLRRNGWRGAGGVPWSHEPNRGFLRCLYALRTAAEAIGEGSEADRCAQLLHDCDPAAEQALAGSPEQQH